MKHIIKTTSLENLPETRPLIAMDGNGVLKWAVKVGPPIEMVDLGLSSGTLWAKTNVGAQVETDYGDYFMWGYDVQNEGWINDKTSHPYSWSEYTKFTNGTYNSTSNKKVFTKYIPTSQATTYWAGEGPADNLTTLEAVDDVVSVIYGSKYKMPEKEHFDELISGTNKIWATINGIRGYKFTNKTDTSKYIFIPAAGYCNGTSLSGKGSECYCWASSLNINSPYASWYLSITSSGGATTTSGRSRCYGCTIRAISTQN